MMAMIDWWLYYWVRISPATLTHIFSWKIFQLRAHEGLLIAHVFAFFSISQKLSKNYWISGPKAASERCQKCSTDVVKQCLTLASATSILCSFRSDADRWLIKIEINMRSLGNETSTAVFHIFATCRVAHLVFNLFLDASGNFLETLTQRGLVPQIPVCIKFALLWNCFLLSHYIKSIKHVLLVAITAYFCWEQKIIKWKVWYSNFVVWGNILS